MSLNHRDPQRNEHREAHRELLEKNADDVAEHLGSYKRRNALFDDRLRDFGSAVSEAGNSAHGCVGGQQRRWELDFL